MITKPVALMALTLAATLVAGPVFAQGAVRGASGRATQKAVNEMHKRKQRHKQSCYDYAWQSQEMKDCLEREKAK